VDIALGDYNTSVGGEEDGVSLSLKGCAVLTKSIVSKEMKLIGAQRLHRTHLSRCRFPSGVWPGYTFRPSLVLGVLLPWSISLLVLLPYWFCINTFVKLNTFVHLFCQQ